MIPRPAQYLLRFDDLCPTMAASRWAPFERLIGEFGIQPILAVVPENQDPELAIDEPAAELLGAHALDGGGRGHNRSARLQAFVQVRADAGYFLSIGFQNSPAYAKRHSATGFTGGSKSFAIMGSILGFGLHLDTVSISAH